MSFKGMSSRRFFTGLILGGLPVFFATGCSGLSTNFNTATNAQEHTVYSTDREQDIGASVAREIEKEFKLVDDPAVNVRVDRITARIAAVCDRRELVFVAKVIGDRVKPERDEKPVVNAVSLPGGYLYVFQGLLDYIKNDDQLAAVIAHEVGHVTARHSIKRIQASYVDLTAFIASLAVDHARFASAVGATSMALFFDYSQKDELEADALGVKYMKAAGFDPKGMTAMLEALDAYDKKQPIRPLSFGRTHPYIHQRLAAVDRLIAGDMSFRDWVRTTGEGPGK